MVFRPPEGPGERHIGCDLGRVEGPSPDYDRPPPNPGEGSAKKGTRPYLPSAPTRPKPAAGALLVLRSNSLFLLSLPEWSSTAHTLAARCIADTGTRPSPCCAPLGAGCGTAIYGHPSPPVPAVPLAAHIAVMDLLSRARDWPSCHPHSHSQTATLVVAANKYSCKMFTTVREMPIGSEDVG